MKIANITYQHGSKYTKSWIGMAKYDTGGGFSLSYLYNGGRFTSKRKIENYIYTILPVELKKLNCNMGSITLLKENNENQRS